MYALLPKALTSLMTPMIHLVLYPDSQPWPNSNTLMFLFSLSSSSLKSHCVATMSSSPQL